MIPHYFMLENEPQRLVSFFPFYRDGQPWKPAGGRGSLRCAISRYAAGSQRITEDSPPLNRLALFSHLGLSPETVASCSQTHSKEVVFLPGPAAPAARPSADGLATANPALMLSVTVADCLPIYLADVKTGAVALLHSGWKGTGIVLNALALLARECGTQLQDVCAVLGPCIQGSSYQVDSERATVFEAEFGRGRGRETVIREVQGRFYLDLQKANRLLLAEAGVVNVSCCQNCTFTDPTLGSYRREGSSDFTRMVAMLGFFPDTVG